MFNYNSRYMLILFFWFLTIHGTSNTENNGSVKVLVLIIASDQFPVYKELQRLWRSYMHLDREHVEVYFIKGDPDMLPTYMVDDDIIWSKTTDGWAPASAGIINKTLLSMEAFLPEIQTKFDYVLRTNLSSFYYFPKLIDALKEMPRKNVYYGSCIPGFPNIASGCGFVISSDLAQMLVENKNELMDHVELNDDDLIGNFFVKRNIPLIIHKRASFYNVREWEENQHTLTDDIFHCRVKNYENDLRATEDVHIYSKMIEMFYGITLL